MYRRLYKWMMPVVLAAIALAGIASGAQAQPAIRGDSLSAAVSGAASDTARANVYLELSRVFQPTVVTKEFYYASEALNLAQKAGWTKGVMYAEQLIGDSYNKVMAYNDAIAHYNLSIAAARKLNRTDIESACLQLVANACHDVDQLQNAVTYQYQLLRLTERLGEPAAESQQLNRYALRLSDVGRYRDAIDYLQRNISFAESHFAGQQQMNITANILNTLANTYLKVNRADSALYCLRRASDLVKVTGNYEANAYIISTFCDVYTALNTIDSAIIYGTQTVNMSEAIHTINLDQHYCQVLSQLYEKTHDAMHALYYYKKYDSLTGIINNTRKTIDEAMQVTKINMEQQSQHNTQEKRSLETIRRNQRAALIAALTAMVTLITLTFFIYRNLRQKQKANKIISLQANSLQEQNGLIDKALKEKEVLLKETHHRVKNNLQLISSLLELQAENLESESAKNALRTAQRRVLSIATVHSQLYGSDENEAIEFSPFVSDLFLRLNSAFASEDHVIQFDNRIPDATCFPLNTVVLLGLILNELITNSFKHAFPAAAGGTIRITIERVEDKHILHYYDSGAGLPEGALNADTGSLGLYLVRRLSKQLKGTVIYKSTDGSIFTIIFPYAGG